MTKISFIVPVYNCKDYLCGCVESIRFVEAEDYELLLIDDGSTDGSGALCDELAGQYPEIRVIHQTNGGASAARNRGIQEAEGERVLFLDADDSLDAKALGSVLADHRCEKADLVIFGLTFDYYYRGQCYRRDPLFFEYDGILTKEMWGAEFENLYIRNALSSVCNKVFRRDILMKQDLRLDAGMFLYEDFEFVLRYLQHCDTIWNVPKAIYQYRQPEDEGKAVRRLKRIDCLPDFLLPIETALEALTRANPHVPPEQKDGVLQGLYLVLAREKISGSVLPEIRRICRDFGTWAEKHNLPLEASEFQKRVQKHKVCTLWLSAKKTALRHTVAVRVKAKLRKKQKERI